MSQSFVAGQAFRGKIRFTDGEFPACDPPKLIVDLDGE